MVTYIELTFTNGHKAEEDFRDMIIGRGGVFAPLEDENYFGRVKVDEVIGTIVWPNGADICPDVLYHEATGESLPANAPARPA